MSKAERTLLAMQKLGRKGIPLTRVYRNLYDEELFLGAYNKLYRNAGSMTPGTTAETVDGMSLKKISQIIESLRQERYDFKPARRVYVPKADGRKRPINIPSFSDKLVQEVVRSVLEAYYEPQFSDTSHGFRPNRGCHTALTDLYYKFIGTKWFIEGDIKGCFDHIDHTRLLDILAEKIKDGRILELIRRMFKAGYLEDWRYNRTYSGTPQGGVISPLLANIYLDKLDKFVEMVLCPKYNFGEYRKNNPVYQKLNRRVQEARKRRDWETYKTLKQQRVMLPSKDTHDPGFSRLKYIRYADDFILSYTGPQKVAEQIRDEIRDFLAEELKLELSAQKTLITHNQDRAKFLGYYVSIYNTGKLSRGPKGEKRRTLIGKVRLEVPKEVRTKWIRRYSRKGKPHREGDLYHSSVPEIIDTFQGRFRGIANYYKFATNRSTLYSVKYIMEQSLTQTLAGKLKLSYAQVRAKYLAHRAVKGFRYRVLQTQVEKKDGTIREVFWGAIPLKRKKPWRDLTIKDQMDFYYYAISRSDLVQRLLTDECELCGKKGECEVHHIKRLSNLKTRWRGRKAKPIWVETMIARHRKTLVVCQSCHKHITATSREDQAM
jgi:group II intron reverse transcriptase/maturase